jgi:hypothetical protein
MRKLFVIVVLFAITVLMPAGANAAAWEKYDKPVPTKVTVRVLSRGAKAMNPNTGALVIIRDAASNEVLDKGDVQGGTGDMEALMNTGYPRVSGMTGLLKGEKGLKEKSGGCETYTSTEDSAAFVGQVMLTRPTQVVIEAHGPMMPHQSGATAVTTTWLFPGEDVTGEGIVLELRGLIVDTLASLKEVELNPDELKEGIDLPFYMRMMCGCPIAPKSFGLPWEAEDFNITVQAYYRGKLYHEEVTTADKLFVSVSQFRARFPVPENLPEGQFNREQVVVRVMASQPKMANFGMDEFSVYFTR